MKNRIKISNITVPLALCLFLILTPVLGHAQSFPGLNPLVNPATTPTPGFPLKITNDVFFPALTGPHQVGRTFYHLVDSTRSDIYLPDGVTGPREFMIFVHYPADVPAGLPQAPYVLDPLKTVLAQGIIDGADPAKFDLIHPHAYMSIPGLADVPVASSELSYPVILFSHGKSMHPLFYSALLENLASQGYIVVSVVHPHDSMVSVLPDPTSPLGFKVLLPPTGAENALTAAAAAGDQASIDALTTYEVMSRPGDLLFTLEYLKQLNAADPLLGGHLNLDTVGAFGHSFGAGTAVWASQRSLEIDATLAMDPTIVPLVLNPATPQLEQAVMFMNGGWGEYGSLIMPDGYWSALAQLNCINVGYSMQSQPFYYFKLDTSTHQTFLSDLVLLDPMLDGFEPYGSEYPIIDIPNERAIEILNAYIGAFFNQELRDTGSSVLSDLSEDYLEVQFLAQPLTPPFACGEPPVDPPEPSVVPEPGTITLLALGVLGLLAFTRKIRRNG